MKLNRALVFIMTVSAFCQSPKPIKKAEPCKAEANERCPDESFISAMQDYKKLVADIEKDRNSEFVRKLQAKIDQATGMHERLKSMLPSGFDWDDDKQKFVSAAAPANLVKPAQPKGPADTIKQDAKQ